MPHSNNPFNTYRATLVPQPNLANSGRIDSLVHNGVLELSLKEAIALSLENNLDLAIARYNIPIAEADILRDARRRHVSRRKYRRSAEHAGRRSRRIRLGFERRRCGRNLGWRWRRGFGRQWPGAVDSGNRNQRFVVRSCDHRDT